MIARTVAVAACLIATAAFAKPRISLVQFRGPHAAAVKAQLSKPLCKTFICVKPGQDGEDVAVDAVVTGNVDKKGKLTVSVYYDEERAPVTREVSLKRGKVPPAATRAVSVAVREAVASSTDVGSALAAAAR